MILLRKPRWTSASDLFCQSRLSSFEALLRTLMYKLICRLSNSQNAIIKLISDPSCSMVRYVRIYWQYWYNSHFFCVLCVIYVCVFCVCYWTWCLLKKADWLIDINNTSWDLLFEWASGQLQPGNTLAYRLQRWIGTHRDIERERERETEIERHRDRHRERET